MYKSLSKYEFLALMGVPFIGCIAYYATPFLVLRRSLRYYLTLPATSAEKFAAMSLWVLLIFAFSVAFFEALIPFCYEVHPYPEILHVFSWGPGAILLFAVPFVPFLLFRVSQWQQSLLACCVLPVIMFAISPYYFQFGGQVIKIEWFMGNYGKAAAAIALTAAVIYSAYRRFRTIDIR